MTSTLRCALTALAALTLSTTALAQHPRHQQPPNQVHIGISVIPLQVSGLVDAHISDYMTDGVGLKSENSANPEARVFLPLADGNTDELGLLPGMKVGYVYDLLGPLTAVAEVAGHFNGVMTVVTAQAGADMFLVDSKHLKIGVPVRVGGLFAQMDFGKLQVLDGYDPPVIIEGPDGTQTFNEGDRLSAELMGPLVSAGFAAEAWLAPNLGLRAEATFMMGFFGDMKIKAGSEDIPFDSEAIVKTDRSGSPAALEPEGGSFGLAGFVGVVYRL